MRHCTGPPLEGDTYRLPWWVLKNCYRTRYAWLTKGSHSVIMFIFSKYLVISWKSFVLFMYENRIVQYMKLFFQLRAKGWAFGQSAFNQNHPLLKKQTESMWEINLNQTENFSIWFGFSVWAYLLGSDLSNQGILHCSTWNSSQIN